MLSFIEVVIAVVFLAWVSWTALGLYIKTKVAAVMMAKAVPYEALTTDFSKTLLILGDSTGVGTGAVLKEDSVAARVAGHVGASYVENQAKNGAAVEDLTTQIQHLHLSHYDLILLQIGGNDILAFHDAKKTAKKLDKIMDSLPEAGNIIFLMAGNVGGATLIPYIARPVYSYLSRKFHKEFGKLAKKRGIIYVNLYRRRADDPFIKNPEQYLSADGLHPSGEGYGVWFEEVKKVLD